MGQQNDALVGTHMGKAGISPAPQSPEETRDQR